MPGGHSMPGGTKTPARPCPSYIHTAPIPYIGKTTVYLKPRLQGRALSVKSARSTRLQGPLVEARLIRLKITL